MIARRLATGVAMASLFAALGAAACSGASDVIPQRVRQCRQLCEAGKSCPPPNTTPASTDCYTICDDLDAINRETQCYPQFDSLYQCFLAHGACGNDCSPRRDVYSDCIADHCSSDPSRDDCGL